MLFPLYRQKISFLVIAIFAGRDNISLLAFSPPAEGNDVVHAQLLTSYPAMTIIAYPFLNVLVPPVGASQSPGLLFFSLDVLLADDVVVIWHKGSRPSSSNN